MSMASGAVRAEGRIKRSDGESLVQKAIDAVKQHIDAQALRVGDTLPGEAYFAAGIGVSRAVMREAFGALGALGILDVANGRKARVAALDGSAMASALGHGVSTAQISVAEVWDVRRTIETRTVVLAAERRTGAEAAEIVALAEAMAADRDDAALRTQHDIAFHAAIARAAKNALFAQIVSSFVPLMQVAVPAAWRTRLADEQRDVMIERHRAVARAIVAGDGDAAADAMGQHFDASIGDVLKAVAQGDNQLAH